MSVTFIPPNNLSLSKNPIPVTLSTADYLANAGSTATATLTVTTAFFGIASGNILFINWSAAQLAFEFVLAPDNSGLQLPSGDASVAHVTQIIAWLNNNFYIDRDYLVTQGVDGNGDPTRDIIITARLFGIIYNLSFTNGTDGLPLAITAAITDGVNTSILPNFKYLFQVWQKSGNNKLYEKLLQLDYPITGTTTKDLQDILHNYLDNDIPDLVTVWQPCQKSFMEYYLRYAPSYGDTPQVQRAFKTGSYFVYLGGFSNLALGVITQPDYFAKSLLPDPSLFEFQRWMETFPVDNFTVRTNSPHFLYFINNRNVAETLAIKVVMTFDTGLPQTRIINGGILQPYNKVCVNCSYQALGLAAYTSAVKMVTGYTVTLIEQTTGNNRSLVKTFTVDRNYEPYTRYLLYSDSAGNFKTLILTGQSQLSSEVTDNTTQAFPDQNTPKTGDIKRYDIENTISDAINSGYINDPNAFDNLQEYLLARYAFRAYGNNLVPIIPTSKKFAYSADGKNQNAFLVEYELAYPETNYTGSTGQLVVPQLNAPQISNNDI